MQVKSGDIELTLKDDNGNTLYPLTYNNVIYLPAEQLADLMGYDTTVTTNSIRLEPKASTDDIGARQSQSDCFKPRRHLCFSGCICQGGQGI